MPSMPVEDKNEGVGQPERGKELQTEDRCWGELCSYSSRRRVWALSGHSYPFIRRTPPPRIMTVFLIWKVFVLIKPNKLPLPFLTELLPCEFRSKGTDHLIFIVKFCEQTQSRRGSWPKFFLVFFLLFFFSVSSWPVIKVKKWWGKSKLHTSNPRSKQLLAGLYPLGSINLEWPLIAGDRSICLLGGGAVSLGSK